jgi:hypothetical protein
MKRFGFPIQSCNLSANIPSQRKLEVWNVQLNESPKKIIYEERKFIPFARCVKERKHL